MSASSDTIVVLTDGEWDAAFAMGMRRHTSAQKRGYRQTDGSWSNNALTNHISGCAAEIAGAKYYEVKWDASIDGFRRIPDLLCCEVRSTAEDNPVLRVKLTDKRKASWPFVLITRLDERRYRIEGWIYGYHAMRQCYHEPCDPHSKKPEFHVPIRDLEPPFTLQPVLWQLRAIRQGAA